MDNVCAGYVLSKALVNSLASQPLHTRGRVWSTDNTRLVIADSATVVVISKC